MPTHSFSHQITPCLKNWRRNFWTKFSAKLATLNIFFGLKVDGQIYLSKKSIKIRTIDLIFKVISNISSDICSSRLISSHLKPKDRIKHLWFRNPMTLKPTRPSLKNLILSTVKHFQDHCGSREQEKVNDNSCKAHCGLQNLRSRINLSRVKMKRRKRCSKNRSCQNLK